MINFFNRKRIFSLFLIIFLIIIFWSSITFQEIFYTLVGEIENVFAQNQILGMGLFLSLAIFSVMFMSFSSIWLVPIALVLWGHFLTIVLLLGGWLLGGIFSYLIGRFAAYPIVIRFISKERLDYYRNYIGNGKRDFGLICLARFVLPSEIPGYVLGVSRYHFGKYFLATFLTEIPYVIITVYAIDAILQKNPWFLISWGIVWLTVATVMFHLLRLKFYDLKLKNKNLASKAN